MSDQVDTSVSEISDIFSAFLRFRGDPIRTGPRKLHMMFEALADQKSDALPAVPAYAAHAKGSFPRRMGLVCA
jgi:hypothetical protein